MGLFNKHQCQWEEVGRTVIKGAPVTQINSMTEHTMLKLVYGFTSVELKCTECGMVTFVDSL